MLETLRPDPTFYPSPKLAMEAPAEIDAHRAHVAEVVSDPLGDHHADPAVKGREPGLADGDHVGRSRGGERRARQQTSEGERKCLLHDASPVISRQAGCVLSLE